MSGGTQATRQGRSGQHLESTMLATFALLAFTSAQDRPVVLLDALEVVGEVQTRRVSLFVSRAALDTDARLELRESFVPCIVKTLEQPPL